MAVPSAAKSLAMGRAGLTSEGVEKETFNFASLRTNPDLDRVDAEKPQKITKEHYIRLGASDA